MCFAKLQVSSCPRLKECRLTIRGDEDRDCVVFQEVRTVKTLHTTAAVTGDCFKTIHKYLFCIIRHRSWMKDKDPFRFPRMSEAHISLSKGSVGCWCSHLCIYIHYFPGDIRKWFHFEITGFRQDYWYYSQ